MGGKIKLAVAAFAVMAMGAQAGAAELRVSGAAAIANTVVLPNKAALEEASGAKLVLAVNGDGNGLKDICAGRSDVMMVAAPLKATEETINKAAPGSVDVTGMRMHQIGSIAIRFIVNPANPVKALSEEQVKGILTGKVSSWKEVGGPDQPILLVAEPAGFGTRTNIVTTLLSGTDISDKARTVQAMIQVAQVVAQTPNAFGYGNAGSINDNVAVIPGIRVEQPIGFATKGEPTPEAKKLIEAARKYGAQVK